ncbi:hypothetical protein [Leptospira sp. GIMC2001]|uniref:hypothetical protein n=1 Tax=Leptospira sp. GIMC2001 TaxID=1513297 RepID=UPI00234B097A|nr:hypothetical protein [Leptospira sp. GIMC2001]WCL51494.1 hypothetical protein O4O04_19965 [Leptospira sp. GIMC2001]
MLDILSKIKGTQFENLDPETIAQVLNKVKAELFDKAKGENREKIICRKRAVGRKGQFLFFCRHYFPHYFNIPFGEQQMELINLIQSYRARRKPDGTKFRPPLKALVAISRGFGKSTILTLCGVLWLLLTGTWKFPILISSTLNQAKEFLRKIQEEIEDNAILYKDFPELMPKKDIKGQNVAWNDYDLVFVGGFRVIAKGWGNAIRGKRHKNIRPDALLLDDPDEEKDVASDTTMTRKYRWLERAALKLGQVWGIDAILSYTTIAPNCVGEYVYNSERYRDWIKHKYRAIITDENGVERSAWPAGAPLETLQKEREDDPITFAQERQNDPLAEIGQKFKGFIQTWEFERPVDWTGWTLALAVDLSLGKTERSDYSAIVGLGLSPQGKFYELFSDIERRRPDQIQKDLIKAIKAFPWNKVGIETNGGQEYFLDGFKKHVEEHNELCANGVDGLTRADMILIPIEGINNSGDKIKRIEGALQTLIESGLMLLRAGKTLLFEMLNEFPYKKLDGPDALEMAHRLITEMAGNFVSVGGGSSLYIPKGSATGSSNESPPQEKGYTLQQLQAMRRKKRGF